MREMFLVPFVVFFWFFGSVLTAFGISGWQQPSGNGLMISFVLITGGLYTAAYVIELMTLPTFATTYKENPGRFSAGRNVVALWALPIIAAIEVVIGPKFRHVKDAIVSAMRANALCDFIFTLRLALAGSVETETTTAAEDMMPETPSTVKTAPTPLASLLLWNRQNTFGGLTSRKIAIR